MDGQDQGVYKVDKVIIRVVIKDSRLVDHIHPQSTLERVESVGNPDSPVEI